MKTISKQIKFGSSSAQKFYHESFENYQEFYDKVMERQSKANKTIERIFDDHSTNWMGCRSVQEAKDLLLGGWEKPLEDLKVQIDKELNTLENKKKPNMFNNVAGFIPVVPNALMGLPKSMIDVRYERKKSKILRFLISIDRACGNSTDEIVKRMSKILAQIASLERSGKYRCRLEVFFTAFGDYSNSSKTFTSCSVLVKSENQLFDARRLCYPVIHPSMLRLLMFAWEESLPMDYSEYYVSGYGTAFEHWNKNAKEDFKAAVNENNEKVIVCDLFSNLQEILDKEQAEMIGKKGGR